MPNILILHGWGSCAKNWENVKGLLVARGFKVFVPDLPGFGQEPPPGTPWNIDDYVEWVKNFANQNDLGRFVLFGHSVGGGIAAKYASKYPENIGRLILAASAIIRRKTFKKEVFRKIAKIFNKFSVLPFYNLFRKVFYKIIVKSDYLSTRGVIMQETYLKIIGEDLSSCLSNISVPTAIIWGEKDDDTPIADAFFINKEIKDSKLEILPGIGHRIRLEAPELLVEKIIKYTK